ncbi:MAG: squalene/phytoene synthase family protein [Betaproteobacteria bacterium]|nr:squalene/phytoene synthase family protein [Betaproteobacteria bacterium]
MPKQSHLQDAEKVLFNKGKSFYWASYLLNKQHAERAARLYYLCRYIDDIGDEGSSDEISRQLLLKVKDAIHSNYSDNEILIDGIDLINECEIDKLYFYDLIEGVISDTYNVRVEDQSQLLRYCYQVAGTVGLMMTKILNTPHEAAYPFAVDLGIAMQLTNICRDVKLDAMMNRRYIPANFINNLEPSSLINPSEQDKVLIVTAIYNMLSLAEKYYESGRKGLSYLPLRARLSILVAAQIYREIGRELIRQNGEYWHHRITISAFKKLLITIWSLLAFSFTTSFWRHPKKHDDNLHKGFMKRVNSELNIPNSHAN